jgi:hypothetical protein
MEVSGQLQAPSYYILRQTNRERNGKEKEEEVKRGGEKHLSKIIH